MFLLRKKLISYLLLLILGITPLMSTAAMVQFDLNKIETHSMQESSTHKTCQNCAPETVDNSCDSDINSCGACVSGIYTSHSNSVQKHHSSYTLVIHPLQFSFISTPNIKPPRT